MVWGWERRLPAREPAGPPGQRCPSLPPWDGGPAPRPRGPPLLPAKAGWDGDSQVPGGSWKRWSEAFPNRQPPGSPVLPHVFEIWLGLTLPQRGTTTWLLLRWPVLPAPGSPPWPVAPRGELALAGVWKGSHGDGRHQCQCAGMCAQGVELPRPAAISRWISWGLSSIASCSGSRPTADFNRCPEGDFSCSQRPGSLISPTLMSRVRGWVSKADLWH